MKFLSVVGARPQFIKLSPLCRVTDAYNGASAGEAIESVVVHTGQHYDYELSRVFFDQLQLPEPNYNLEVGSASHAEQTGAMMERLEKVLLEEAPDVVIVFGDTNSTLAGALTASKLHLPVAHVEAGLRSYDRSMPEEINRVVADHISTILFCPTARAVSNLRIEGFPNSLDRTPSPGDMDRVTAEISADKPLVIRTGDIMYDAFLFNIRMAEQSSSVMKELALTPGRYSLLTIHRAENTEEKNSIERIMTFLEGEGAELPVIFPVHPRTKKFIVEHGLEFPKSVRLIPPVSYFEMIMLEKNARSIYTDSGGVQKEAFFLKVPCVTLRDRTEWTETLESGWNRLMDNVTINLRPASTSSLAHPDIFGDGRAAENHLRVLISFCSSRISEGKRLR